MAYHVEVSASLRHARVFNLSEAELRRAIVEPWLAGRRIALGDREWEPSKSSLRILAGPELEAPDLSFGQGWANAQRSAEDVTRRELAAAAQQGGGSAAIVVETDSPRETVARMVAGLDARQVDWEEAGVGADGRDPEVAAVIVVRRRREPPGRDPERTGEPRS